MTPAPSTKHQQVTGKIFRLIGNHLSAGHPCRVYISPTDVVLVDDQVVQPDVLVVCERSQAPGRRESFGAPDVVFEVLLPYTEIMDRGRKMKSTNSSAYGNTAWLTSTSNSWKGTFFAAGSYGRPRIYRGEQAFTIDAVGLEITASDLFAE